MNCDGKKNSNGIKLGNMSKSLGIINIIDLGEAFGHETNFITF